MKKLLLKIVLLFSIVTGISIGVTKGILPAFWGHPDGQVKLDYLAKSDSVNTLFIGSSRILHHIIPEEFDSLCSANGMHINSFNLGLRQFNMPQSFLMVDEVLKNSKGIQYVFIEVTGIIYDLPGSKTNSPRYYYWYDAEQTRLLCEHVHYVQALDSLNWWERKKQYDFEFCLNLVRKNYFVGGPQSIFISSLDGEPEWINENCERNKGFNPIDLEQGPFVNLFASQRKEFLKDTSILGRRRTIARNFATSNKQAEYTPYAKTMADILKRMKEKNIRVYFVITPSLTRYEEADKLLTEIPKEHIINLSSPDTSPDLYRFDYFFDRTHMNRKGAEVFTGRLAEIFIEKSKVK